MSDAEILERLQDLTDPEIGRTLGELNMLKAARAEGDSLVVEVELPTPAYPGRERISQAIEERLAGDKPVTVSFSHAVRGRETGGSIGLRVKNVIAVGSGKGGVGKSSIAASLAYGLQKSGAAVGLLDADVYGPSIPHMFGVSWQPQVVEQETAQGQPYVRMVPHEVDGLKISSMGFLVPAEQAVIWRGPMLQKALVQLLRDTQWGDLDYLIVDLPPGTGNVPLSLSQMLGLAGAVVVCTPQQVALLDAVKAVAMFRQLKIPVLGMVENMTGEIFGRGGAKAKAEEMGIPFLGEVPCNAEVRIKGDDGQIPALFAEESPVREPLQHVCEATAMGIARELLETPSMPTLEIL